MNLNIEKLGTYTVKVQEFAYLSMFSLNPSPGLSRSYYRAEVEFWDTPNIYEQRKGLGAVPKSVYKGRGPDRVSKAQAEKDCPALLKKYVDHLAKTGERLEVQELAAAKAKSEALKLARKLARSQA